ncbi:MAG TPA: FAD-dependent oxidoreductase [Polyangiaceae bacterium]|nr:FAD-dependent oxidoreductase [Polyangiaceae bacterium]
MKLRQTNIEKLKTGNFDVCVIGGGINGAVSAAALSASGVRVALIERKDFAGVTSQQSSNLAWGGIKYLETFELALVRSLCLARNRLIRAYPSTVREISFYMTYPRGFRWPRVFVWLGAWLYWFIGNCFTRTPRLLSARQMASEEPIIDLSSATGGIEYSDAFLHDNDARFVFNFVRRALTNGCIAANYVEVTRAVREGERWLISVRDVEKGETFVVRSKLIVNAAGPYVEDVNERLGISTRHRHVLSKGVHILVRRLTASYRVLTFFADDGRLFFVIPMGPRTCIGTTDTRVDGPDVSVTEEDRRFVLDNINKRLRLEQPLTEGDIIAERCGVRPLVVSGETKSANSQDWLQLSRKHAIEASDGAVCVFGGKLTDCLNVGEEILDEVERAGIRIPYAGQRWYGEPAQSTRDEFFHQAKLMNLDALTSQTSSEPLSARLWRRYGGQAIGLLEHIREDPRDAELLIEHAEYLRCEIEQAASREMITKLDDFLRRRSKIAQVVSHEALRRAAGVREACRILFGAEADRKYDEYFAEHGTTEERVRSRNDYVSSPANPSGAP